MWVVSGATLSCAIAVGVALGRPDLSNQPSSSHSWDRTPGPAVQVTYQTGGPGWRETWWRIDPDYRRRSYDQEADISKDVRVDLPAGIHLPRPLVASDAWGWPQSVFASYAWGWPCGCLGYTTESGGPQVTTWRLHGGRPLPTRYRPNLCAKIVPLEVLWPGLCYDTAALGGIVVGAIFVPPAARRAWRRANDRCPRCAYLLAGIDSLVCPECGCAIGIRRHNALAGEPPVAPPSGNARVGTTGPGL